MGTISGVYNAADYGSFGAGAAIQDAIDYAAAAGGGTVVIPAGDWLVNAGLVVPVDKPIRLMGLGMAMGGSNVAPTRLRRTSGTTTMISCIGTGQTTGTRGRIEIVDLDISGGSLAGLVVDLQRCQNVYLHRVRIAESTTTGIRLRELFNSSADNLYIHGCGNGTAAPAMLLDAVSGVGTQGGNDTVQFSHLEFEGNAGTDLKIDGFQDGTNFSPSSNISFNGMKFEANSGSTPYIDLAYCQQVRFCDVQVTAYGSAVPVQMTHPLGLARANQFVNLTIDCETGTAPYGIKLGRGALQLSNLTVLSPTTAAIRIESTAAADELRVTGLYTNVTPISDGRTRSEFVSDDVHVVPQAGVYNSGSIGITGGMLTAITFNSERYDLGTATEQHSTSSNTSRLTCRVPGLYAIGGNVRFDGLAGTLREVRIRLNGGTPIADHSGVPALVGRYAVSTEYRLNAGDYVELVVYHDAPGPGPLYTIAEGNSTPEFWFSWRSP